MLGHAGATDVVPIHFPWPPIPRRARKAHCRASCAPAMAPQVFHVEQREAIPGLIRPRTAVDERPNAGMRPDGPSRTAPGQPVTSPDVDCRQVSGRSPLVPAEPIGWRPGPAHGTWWTRELTPSGHPTALAGSAATTTAGRLLDWSVARSTRRPRGRSTRQRLTVRRATPLHHVAVGRSAAGPGDHSPRRPPRRSACDPSTSGPSPGPHRHDQWLSVIRPIQATR